MAVLPPAAPVVELSHPPAPIAAAPRPSPPPSFDSPQPRRLPDVRSDDTYLAQARWTLANVVPRTAAQTRSQIARALWIASTAYHPADERLVIEAAASGIANGEDSPIRDIAPTDARRLHDGARQAYWWRRNVADALELQLKAFGANPNDADVAGQLALLYLKSAPVEPERARQLALHAIGIQNARYAGGKPDDWMTFAVASALTGRQADATHALYASVALTRSVDRVCRMAVGALSQYGERMREPVEALLQRLHSQRRDGDSPYCAWPPNRVANNRYG